MTEHKKKYNILIVEDEVLIADTIQRYVESEGHTVVGQAISFEEGQVLFDEQEVDLVLLDIRLNGPKTGIDLAHYIRTTAHPKPFIYLTAQADSKNIELAKETFPAGYLSKPLQKQSLVASMEIAMHKYFTAVDEVARISLNDGTKKYLVPIAKIQFLQSEHVYVQVYVEGEGVIVQRSSLKELLGLLPEEMFIQTHRSYAVNRQWIKHWNGEAVIIGEKSIPISRSKKKVVTDALKTEN